MSVYSMTGYASGQQDVASGVTEGASAKRSPARLGLELRSVNSRFLDLGFRLSDELRQHEPALRELLNRRLKRGKVELRAYLQNAGDGALTDPPARMLQRLASVQDQVRAWLPDAAPLSVAEALRVTSGVESASGEDTAQALLQLAASVTDDFVAARAREVGQPFLQPLAHLARRLLGEGDGQDLGRLGAFEQRAQDARHQHPGLARACARLHRHVAARVAGDGVEGVARAGGAVVFVGGGAHWTAP